MLGLFCQVTTVNLHPMLGSKQLFMRYGVLTILQQSNIGSNTVPYLSAEVYQLNSLILPPSKIQIFF
jgi:hypothetical protein